MPNVIFVESDGQTHEVEAEVGSSLMASAVGNGVPGILADCGGDCACATCHVYVDDDWSERIGPPNPMEDELLSAREDRRDNSRLSCQVNIEPDHEGLRVFLPEEQF
ncbi:MULTISPECIES: 2Fe-2S iron-sulfur cluster-binding protein [unclassified Thioalkalivibrio]|uniref:2Fe-2S iron-sulfur cluster-binding protein n=1 Tax=unclassified Thioalkalivibrio TaxID=2621013 RepID=UPI000462B906|nr:MULTISPECIES: 2Fe-2S iron-sulfur cluster-binding protein [unclassified Thioalkalivibrio]PYG01418.1 2Fe-2S ferredoxin [Thioalkalivibrio sp. ALE21]